MNKKYNILILGAGGKRAGYENLRIDREKFTVYGSSMNWVNDTKSTVDVSLTAPSSLDPRFGAFLDDVIQRHHIDIIVPKSEQDLVFFSKPSSNRFRDKVILSDPDALTLLSNKKTLAETLMRAGLYDMAIPELSTTELLNNPNLYPVIVKNKTGSGSENIQIVHDADSLPTFNENRIIQQYHEGVHWIVDVLFTPDGIGPYFIPYRVLAKNNYVSLDVIIDFAPDVIEACKRLFEGLMSLGLKFRGQVNFDMVNQQNHRTGTSTWRVMDFNVRKGATCRYHMTAGFSYYDVIYDYLLYRDSFIPRPSILLPVSKLDRTMISNIEIPRLVR